MIGASLGLAEPADVRAADTATGDASRGASSGRGVQQQYESCLRQLDEGAAAAAANCLWDVYIGLVAIDTVARADLYYVLADAVAASQAAASEDPQALCVARRLLDDWAYRERKAPQLRLRRKANKLSAAVDQAMGAAGVVKEACPQGRLDEVERAPEVAKPEAVRPAVAEGERGEGAGAEGVVAEAKVEPQVAAPPKPSTPRTVVPRMTRQLKLTAKTDLMDAGFVTTIASIGVAGLGGAMWAAKIECDARDCGSDVPQGVRDAGLALMSIGAAGVIVGLSLRWVDQRRQRKLRQAPLPSVGPTSLGLSWRGQF